MCVNYHFKIDGRSWKVKDMLLHSLVTPYKVCSYGNDDKLVDKVATDEGD